MALAARVAALAGRVEALEAACVGERRVADACRRDGIAFTLVRVPDTYYDQTLAVRRRLVGAASIHHLWKSILLVNRNHAADGKAAYNPRFVLALVPYTARLSSTKLNRAVRDGRPESTRLGRNKVIFSLVDAGDAAVWTGYGHNAMPPVGLQLHLPDGTTETPAIVCSHRMEALLPSGTGATSAAAEVYFGGGEVLTKLRLGVAELLRRDVGGCCGVAVDGTAVDGGALMVADITVNEGDE